MPLFRCSKCGSIDNTAMGDYWMDTAEGRPPLCVECKTGVWHGEFPKEPAEPLWERVRADRKTTAQPLEPTDRLVLMEAR